jgi:hypothetical protein
METKHTESDGVASTDSILMRIITELASTAGCEPTELDPLADSICLDSLEELVTTGNDVSVSFNHSGYQVHVKRSGSSTDIDVSANDC